MISRLRVTANYFHVGRIEHIIDPIDKRMIPSYIDTLCGNNKDNVYSSAINRWEIAVIVSGEVSGKFTLTDLLIRIFIG